MEMKIHKSPLRLYASANAVITLYLSLPGEDRVRHIAARVAAMDEDEARSAGRTLMNEFGHRHRRLAETFLDHCRITEQRFGLDLLHLPEEKRILLGAFLTKEYSIQSAALFNPSIVPHPSQDGLQPGEQRFVMSLRATGEGHISSIVFRSGTFNHQGEIRLDPSPEIHTRLKKNETAAYGKDFVRERAVIHADFDPAALPILPDSFTAGEAMDLIRQEKGPAARASLDILGEIFDTNYELEDSSDLALNEKVIFPSAKGESMGMEDLRFVKFTDGDRSCYYGTYTAYDGKSIRTQIIETADFSVFKARTLFGDAIADKGMALFPEKVNGKYAMIGRQGGQNMSIMFSADLYRWDTYKVLMTPRYSWELLQLGNCGSPIRTDRGWLLLVHGVGLMRKYVISAILLDLDDPARIVSRLETPFLEAEGAEREGYVPNVVYTCGLLRHAEMLLIPYAVSDSATGFITVQLNELLDALTAAGNSGE